MGQRNEFNRGAALRSLNGREFVRGGGSALATTVSSRLRQRAWARASDHRKVEGGYFRGGAGDEETFAPVEEGNCSNAARRF